MTSLVVGEERQYRRGISQLVGEEHQQGRSVQSGDREKLIDQPRINLKP